jgi:hypothetical protein
MIIPIALRLATFNRHGRMLNHTFAEDRYIIWTQVELAYSLISGTIPCMRPVMNNLITHYGTLGPAETRKYASRLASSSDRPSNGQHSSGYQLSALQRSRKDSCHRSTTEAGPTTMADEEAQGDGGRPESSEWSRRLEAGYDHGTNTEIAVDTPTVSFGRRIMGSDDSQRMIISKVVSFRWNTTLNRRGTHRFLNKYKPYYVGQAPLLGGPH